MLLLSFPVWLPETEPLFPWPLQEVPAFKGNGYSTDLLNACIEDSKAKGKKGICILSAAKKKPFLADPKFLKYKGNRYALFQYFLSSLLYIPWISSYLFLKFKNAAVDNNLSVILYPLSFLFNALSPKSNNVYILYDSCNIWNVRSLW